MAEYALTFHTLTAGSGWNKPAVKAASLQTFNQEVITELACCDDKMSIDSLIDLAIHLGHLICNHQVHNGVVSTQSKTDLSEPMQLGQT